MEQSDEGKRSEAYGTESKWRDRPGLCISGGLSNDFQKPGVAQLLRHFGYESIKVEEAIEHLKERLIDIEDFPHEIGLFLGYPVKDVAGFLFYKGSHCKCTGCWKVYDNELEALRTFAMFDKCRKIYVNLWNQGRSIMKLTVAAYGKVAESKHTWKIICMDSALSIKDKGEMII